MSNRQSTWKLDTTRRKQMDDPTICAESRVPRIARLMALAIKLDEQVRQGVFRDYAEIARLGYITRARLTQIMNLLNLAPDIQEALLLTDDAHSSDELNERQLRALTKYVLWHEQRSTQIARVIVGCLNRR